MLAVFVGVGLLIDGGPIASGIVLAVAILMALAGVGLIISALGLFFRSKTRAEPWRGARLLVAAGPYRFTRNPMYLGMVVVGLAAALGLSSFGAAVGALLAGLIVDRIVIRREEAYLTRRFGDDYRAYLDQVRRWL
ncbi:isoprenylcysteine carboxylmethyltransferase family protein [Sphingomonas rhizophila]|nr:isoprenylcysteine carboxylmethyltransferase family protein [Sphingomonas rhizophila]QNN65616.1 isoprenylcysteine carboxylmethyltransferase family protein [Sphingomonas rhizophila]